MAVEYRALYDCDKKMDDEKMDYVKSGEGEYGLKAYGYIGQYKHQVVQDAVLL
ncbi:hypothetical protein [Neobacillus drentensis]|uniref:hypothetical protein n=1 Tax=Neobacillus drentensis TaxID=220684 RepID=UPI000A753E00|nr:hypothetical protein [Neobacillus drentensis]